MRAAFHIPFAVLLLTVSVQSQQVRVKDMADVQGVSRTPLLGYGLVVGLAGTGDGPGSGVTQRSTLNLLRNMGLEVDRNQIRLRNVAAVLVTADLPPFAKPGGRVDVHVSSMGDARSLTGGVLLMAPLKGPDGELYAVAQGPLGTAGGIERGLAGASISQGQSATGVIPAGAIVQRENLAVRLDDGPLRLSLRSPDFTVASALATSIETAFGKGSAIAEDAASVRFTGKEPKEGRASLIAKLENLRVEMDRPARIVVNERTGTIVAGSDVLIDEVAVTHGSLTIKVDPGYQTSQPNAFAAGTTRTTATPSIQTEERQDQVRVLPASTNVGELARALNTLGASPRDLIAILEAIQKSGALQAELVVM
ncbi:MAG: flagellar basal body P-ring protein FlgI [Fibrobacteria bacterium]|nr:flagellar basal body P-ring protein FlgI [Fibrobacteria bacterium]